jgi:hypothetical protein
MFQSNTLLLPLPISNQANHNIIQINNKTKFLYFKPFLTINITTPYISIADTIITLTNIKLFLRFNIKPLYVAITHNIIKLAILKSNKTQY